MSSEKLDRGGDQSGSYFPVRTRWDCGAGCIREDDLRLEGAAKTPTCRLAENDDEDVEDCDDQPNSKGENKLTFWNAVAHLLISGVSPTILNLPAAFHQVGYAIASVGCVLVVVLYAYCMRTIVSCERILCARTRQKRMSYWQVLHFAFATGPPATRWLRKYAKPVTYAVFLGIWGGGNATYVLLIAENVQSIVAYFYGFVLPSRTIIACVAIPLVLLCWIPNLKMMAVCSTLSNAINAGCILIVAVIDLREFTFAEGRVPLGDLSKLPYFLGVVLITVNGTGLLLSLKNEMENPNQFRTKFGVINVAYVPMGALYAIFGLLCYAKYGDRTAQTVILNLPRSAFSCAIQGMYATAVILFYPLVTYVTYEIFWQLIAQNKAEQEHFWLKYAIKTGNASLSVALAYALPDITLFVSLIGNAFVAVDSVILPAIMEILVHWETNSVWLRSKIAALVFLGMTLVVVGFDDLYRVLYA